MRALATLLAVMLLAGAQPAAGQDQLVVLEGVVEPGVEAGCWVMWSFPGGLYNLFGEVPAPGSWVRVWGYRHPEWYTFCMQGIPFDVIGYRMDMSGGPVLVWSEPPMDGTLPKTRNNVILLRFDGEIVLPAGPALSIIKLNDGTDVSASFTYTLQTTTLPNDTLKGKENGLVLGYCQWYRVTPAADLDVEAFVRDFCTVLGDADGNGTLLAQDYFPIKNHLFEVTDKRYDLDGSGQVLAQDYFVIKNALWMCPTKPPKP